MAKSYKRIEKIIKKIYPDYFGLKDDFRNRGFLSDLKNLADKGINVSKYHMTSIEAYAIINILGSIIVDYDCNISFEDANLKKIIKGANEILQEEKIPIEVSVSDELIELLTHLLITNYNSLEIEVSHMCNCSYCNSSVEETEIELYTLMADYEGENLLDNIEYINANK